MRLIIEARLDGDQPTSKPVQLGVIERDDDEISLSTLGLNLAEGRALLRAAQEDTVSVQVGTSVKRTKVDTFVLVKLFLLLPPGAAAHETVSNQRLTIKLK